MTNRAVLVMGGAVRIGRALALAFAHEGFDIALHYNNSDEQAKATADDIRALGVACELFQTNLENLETVESLIGEVTNVFAHLNVLINSASVFEPTSLAQTSTAFLQRMQNVNFNAPFILSREFALACNAGSIINLLDTNIVRNGSTHGAYLLAKKNLAELTAMAALEWAPHIRVNGIAPGATLPPPGKDQTHLEAVIAKVPSQKQVELRNLTDAALLLARNTDITGQILYLDGGEHL